MRRAVAIAAALLVAAVFFAGQQTNPPGFAQDESSIAYNAYQIARHGVDEHGVAWPLYFRAFGEYKNPIYIYALAGVFKCVVPSNLVARRLSASLVLAAVFALAWLAWAISRSMAVAVMTLLTAAATPNLFEIGRIAFEVAAYPLVLALFLIAAHTAFRRERWSAGLVLALASTLIALTYTYSIGRLHAPLLLALFAILSGWEEQVVTLNESGTETVGAHGCAPAALGLTMNLARAAGAQPCAPTVPSPAQTLRVDAMVIVKRRRLLPLAALVALYVALAIVPAVVFNTRHGGALTERFRRLSYVPALRDQPAELLAALEQHALQNLAPLGYALVGDPNERHHVKGSGGSVLLMTFILAAIGAAVTLPRRDRWWWFVAGGTILSVVPAVLTNDVYHSLRLVPYPMFLIVLSMPALEMLLRGKRPIAASLLLLGLAQALWFFSVFEADGPKRTNAFDAGFGRVFAAALAQPPPLYVSHSVFMQAYWYGAQRGLDARTFQVVWDTAAVPPGSVVIGNEPPCAGCIVIRSDGAFSVWRVQRL